MNQRPIGATIDGKFRILSVLGAGGYGVVYKAEQIGFDREVAVKVLIDAQEERQERMLRFEREAKVLCTLRNPHIVDFFSFGFDEGTYPYFAMQYVDGCTLGHLLDNDVKLPDQKVIELARQCCSALSAAHKEGIIHRDLKPQNIILIDGQTDCLKLIDFGLSRWMPDVVPARQKLTQTGCVVGTVYYMSPEVCVGRPADPRSDIYSLACIVYQCLSGRTPFEGEEAINILYGHANSPPARLCKNGSQSPMEKDLELVVFKGLQKDPADRFQSMAEFESALTDVAAGRSPQLDAKGVRFKVGTRPAKVKVVPLVMGTAAISSLALAVWFNQARVVDGSSARESQTAAWGVNAVKDVIDSGDRRYFEALGAHDPAVKRAGLRDAISIYEKVSAMAAAIKIDRYGRHAQAKKGRALYQLKDYDGAIATCKPLFETNGLSMADTTEEIETRIIAMDSIGQAYAAAGDYKSMLPWIEHSSNYHHRWILVDRSVPTLAAALQADFTLGEVHAVLGNRQQAMSILQEAIDAWPLSKSAPEYIKARQILERLRLQKGPARAGKAG